MKHRSLNKHFHRFHITAEGGPHEGAAATGEDEGFVRQNELGIGVCTVLEEEANGFVIATRGRGHKRGRAPVVGGVYVCAVGEEILNRLM